MRYCHYPTYPGLNKSESEQDCSCSSRLYWYQGKPQILTDSKATLSSFHIAMIQYDNITPILTDGVDLPLKPGTGLVETIIVALNPGDYKMGAAFPIPGAVIDMDFQASWHRSPLA